MQVDAAALEELFQHEGVAADVVLAEHGHVELALGRRVVQADDVLEQAVVGDVVPGRLAHAAVALATEGEDVDAEFLLHFAGHGMHVVADQAHGAGREDGDRLGVEDVEGLLDRLAEPLHAAEDDVFLLHVGREAVGDEVLVAFRGRLRLVAAREPRIEAAADRPVGDVDDVAGRPQHHALAARIGAAPLADDAGDRADVGRKHGHGRARFFGVDDHLRRPFPRDLRRIDLQQFVADVFGIECAGLGHGGVPYSPLHDPLRGYPGEGQGVRVLSQSFHRARPRRARRCGRGPLREPAGRRSCRRPRFPCYSRRGSS